MIIPRMYSGAAHKRSKENGHFPVSFAGEGTGSHNSGDRAAEADKQRDDTSS